MYKDEIYKKMTIARTKRYITNCYSIDMVEHSLMLWTNEDEFIFSYEDNGVNRLAYFVKSWNTIDALLDKVDAGKYYLEFMSRNPDEYRPNKSIFIARMLRLANPDCSSVFSDNSPVLQYKDTAVVERAKETDVAEINGILWSTFHTEISHLLTDNELKEKIGQLTVHRNEKGHIDALLQADVMPKKFYINQIVNRTERNVVHAILLDSLEKYVKSGGKYLYAWVDDKNMASLKFHKKYGMKHDGMYSMIFRFER